MAQPPLIVDISTSARAVYEIDPATGLPISQSTSDATAANQVLQIAQETAINGKLPATLGQKTGAASLSVVWASDATLPAGTNAIGTVTAAGNVAAGVAATGNPVPLGGVYNSTITPVTTGQRTNIQTTDYGAVMAAVTVLNSTGTNGRSKTNVGYAWGATSGTGGGSQYIPSSLPYIDNGTTLDIVRKPNVFKSVASSAASGNPDFAKASAGDITMFWGLCAGTAAYLQLYNKASAPTVGTDTPVLRYPLLANAAFSETIPNGGAYFGTGIAFAFTTDAAGTTGSAAAAVTAFALLVA